MLVNRDGFADLTGLSPSTVNRRLAQGMPGTRLPSGEWRIDTARAIDWLVAREAAKRRPGHSARDEADTRVAVARARLAELRLSEEQRLWITPADADLVAQEQYGIIVAICTELLPGLANVLAKEMDPAECRRILREGVNLTLALIAKSYA